VDRRRLRRSPVGGDIGAETKGDRVLLSGQAVTVVESRLRIPA
jgi:hypothetical protein